MLNVESSMASCPLSKITEVGSALKLMASSATGMNVLYNPSWSGAHGSSASASELMKYINDGRNIL